VRDKRFRIDSRNRIWSKKSNNINLGLANIQKSEINFHRVNDLKNWIKDFFNNGYWENSVRNYCKCVWLTNDYLKKQSFDNPIGLFSVPNELLWQVHPGLGRSIILYHFGEDIIPALVYNADCRKVKFNKIFKNANDIDNYFNKSNIRIEINNQVGNTEVPHVHIDSNLVEPKVVEMKLQIEKFFKETHIDANFDMKEYGYNFKVTHPKSSIKVSVESKESIDKAFLLMPLYKNFENYGVKIECT